MTLLFLNLGGGEIFVVLLVVLMFFGSNKLPELAKGLGKAMREMKDAANGVQREIEQGAKDVTSSTGVDEIQKEINKHIKE